MADTNATTKNPRKVLKVLTIGKGQTMEIIENESEPEDSIHRYMMDTASIGDEEIDIPPHWHKNHQENFTVLEGELHVKLDGKDIVLKAGDPTLIIPRLVFHSMKAPKGKRVVFREQPDPPGLYKALFFNDMFSKGGFGGVPHTLRAFYDGDAYLALPLGSRLVDEGFLTVFGGLAHLFTGKKPERL